MDPVTENIRTITINAGRERYVLNLDSEDFSLLYPGFKIYTLTLKEGEKPISVFRTNSYEYSPRVPLTAESVARRTADEWEQEIRNNPVDFILKHGKISMQGATPSDIDLVVIQGSPRADGNCSILAGWAVEAAHDLGMQSRVIYPHDLDIRCCIGCYQCYNTGSCVFDDDMRGIIDAIRSASLLIVCSPVYTNTVPAGLKLLIDRCQAYHAQRILHGGRTGQRGLVFSVAGRKGEVNFTCVTRVITAFLRNLGITPIGDILIDSVDDVRDIRLIQGLEKTVREKVKKGLVFENSPVVKLNQDI
jgi:multimeric flavodoxin WrbA